MTTDDGTGFVRLVLVPVDKMMDKKAHDKYAFHFLCMNEGLHLCPDRSFDTCGNDAEGMAWHKEVEVPTSYPDGVYVFGWSWYGGGDYRAMSFFGDYYSCSYVEIKGGVAVTEKYEPKWDGHKCVSSTDRLGVCWKEPCHVGRMYEMEPAEFKNGIKPEAIKRWWFDENDNDDRQEGTAAWVGPGVITVGGRSRGRSDFDRGGRDSAAASLGMNIVGSSGNSNGREDLLKGGSGSAAPAPVQVPDDDKVFNTEMISTGALGVFFLDFTNWEKLPLHDGQTYRLDNFKKGMTVEAFYNGDVKHIDFFIDGERVRRERSKPYVMQGNRGDLIFGWKPPKYVIVKVQVQVTTRSGRTEGFEADIEFE